MSKASNAVLALSRAFYGKRLDKRQYTDLLSCKSLAEVASYLRTRTVYSGVFEGAGASDLTAKTLENTIVKYNYGHFISLCRYELAIGSEFYKYFIVKTEVEQILRCTLLMLGGSTESYLMQMNPFLDKHLGIDLYALGKANSLEEMAAVLDKTAYGAIFRRCLSDQEQSYLTFEFAFGSFFEQFKDSLVDKCFSGGERAAMREAVCRAFDMSFIAKQYRIAKYYRSNNAVTNLAMPSSVSLTLFSEKQLREMSLCKNEQELLLVLKKSPYKDWFGNDSGRIEREANEGFYNYCKKQVRFSSFPGVVMYSYLFLAGTQETNLVRIIEGIKFKVPAEKIRNSLVGAGD